MHLPATFAPSAIELALARNAFTVTRGDERVGDVFGTLAAEGVEDFLLFTPLAGADSDVDLGDAILVRRSDGRRFVVDEIAERVGDPAEGASSAWRVVGAEG